MIWRGEVLPIVYFYKDGGLVWDYVMPDGFKSREDMREYLRKLIADVVV